MNPVSAISWLWRGLRGRSITFALLFATTLLGFSVLHGVRVVLGHLGLGWFWAGLLLPAALVAVVARKEKEWVPDAAERLKWARALIYGSIIAAALSAVFMPEPAQPIRQEPVVRPIGPRSK